MVRGFYEEANGKSLKTVVTWLFLLAVCLVATVSPAEVPGLLKARMGTLNGTFYVQDRPLSDAIISFFNTVGGSPPVVGSVRRVPDIVSRTSPTGTFSVRLPPGTILYGGHDQEKE